MKMTMVMTAISQNVTVPGFRTQRRAGPGHRAQLAARTTRADHNGTGVYSSCRPPPQEGAMIGAAHYLPPGSLFLDLPGSQ